ncbi:peptidoglycan/LPS O-acetylase OafA/YrhL [Epilithonimonas hungarica]|uniref:acyltransferase family protein n=1 Tax=Epilithonimonas hungarica TaxID=454006 RepID=UPI00277FEA30|nr:acyltransferase [Epilithonimonas hungarica]MDP9956821.1 peptidoglycan/LPS O-acetylase OafA/YrhL [Epilithonimonas hungarica]
MQNRLQKLEALRGFAAVYVVFYHLFASGLVIFGINFSLFFRFGQEAVILFFLLSGFVIYYSSFISKNTLTFKSFFWKRFLRIYIPLIIVFITNYIIFSIYKKGFFKIDIFELLGNLSMLQDNVGKKPNVICNPFLDNEPLWSLSYEWWFYFLFFIIMKIEWMRNKDSYVFILCIFASITYLFYPFFINRELMYLAIWWSGLYIAKLYMSSWDISFKNLKLPTITILIICIILSADFIRFDRQILLKPGILSKSPFLEFRHFLFTLIILLAIPIWKKMKWIGFKHFFGLFQHIAPISFVIYISHWFLIYNASYLDFIQNKNIELAIYFIICIIYSYTVERIIYPFFYKKFKKIINF